MSFQVEINQGSITFSIGIHVEIDSSKNNESHSYVYDTRNKVDIYLVVLLIEFKAINNLQRYMCGPSREMARTAKSTVVSCFKNVVSNFLDG